MREYVKAMDLFIEVQKISGFEADSYGCLGGLYSDMNQPEKANEYLAKLLKAEKKAYHQNIAFHFASIYAQMDKPDKMYHYLNMSIEKKENTVRIPVLSSLLKRLGLGNSSITPVYSV